MMGKLKSAIPIFVGTLIIVCGIHFFMIPNHFVPGSISGLALVLANFIPLPVSAVTLILNMICLVLGFIFIGREFGTKVVVISVLQPAIMYVFEQIFPNVVSPTGEMSMDAVCMIMFICLGQTILFRANAASGGLDVIAMIMNKYMHMDLGKALIICGFLPVACSVFAYDIQTVVIGAMLTYLLGVVLDMYLESFSRKKRVCVISDQYEAIRKYIIDDMDRGVTVSHIKGGYDGKDRVELLAIMDKNEYGRLLDFIAATDNKAFVTISDVNKVVGTWNTSNYHGYF
ncbi:MAG: YitT family protein [Lachnospiraceae bacterium]|nr:YitT family protein [Lachnospiraceae bacterium]